MTSFLNQLSIVVRHILESCITAKSLILLSANAVDTLFRNKRKTLKSAKAIYTSFGRLHSLQNDAMPTKQEGVVAIKD